MRAEIVRVNELSELCDVRETHEALRVVGLQVVEGGAVVYRQIRTVVLLASALEVVTDDDVPHYFRRPFDFISVLIQGC